MMERRWVQLVLLALLLPPFSSSAVESSGPGPALTGRQVMDLVDERDDGDRLTEDMQMVLIGDDGSRRTRHLWSQRMDRGRDTYSLMFFVSPADVKDTGFLVYDYDEEDRDDDQWLHLPALGKTKRIASRDKSTSFMGSDFN